MLPERYIGPFTIGPYTIGSGHLYSIKQIAQTILKLTDHNVPITFDMGKPNTAIYNQPQLRIIAGKTTLEEGIKKTIEWYKENNC